MTTMIKGSVCNDPTFPSLFNQRCSSRPFIINASLRILPGIDHRVGPLRLSRALLPILNPHKQYASTPVTFQRRCAKDNFPVQDENASYSRLWNRALKEVTTLFVEMIVFWLIWKLPKRVVVVSSLALLKFIPHPLGKSSKKVVPENILFDDLVGLEDAKPLFQKILHRVRKRKNKKLEIGILDVVLLYGPKGTGKTTLVHALAREAKVPFFPISARDIARSEAGREEIKSLFIEARASTPSIVYIQDIDAISRHGESGESEETLYELCDEIEKCIEDGRLMVIATTDRPETLDPTLMSRFIRKVHVGRPNEDSRRKFFGLKFNEFIKEEDKEAIYNLVASQTPGFVWGDLIRTALISLQLAARRDDNYMTMDAVLESLETTKSAFNETEAVVRDHMQHMVNTMDFKYQN